MKNKKTLIIILVALVLFLAGAFVRLQNQKQLLIEQEEETKDLQQEVQEIESTYGVAEAEALLDQIEIESLDDDFEVIDKDLDQL